LPRYATNATAIASRAIRAVQRAQRAAQSEHDHLFPADRIPARGALQIASTNIDRRWPFSCRDHRRRFRWRK
jgi:hypothetical protein